jgi:hypothetical protein
MKPAKNMTSGLSAEVESCIEASLAKTFKAVAGGGGSSIRQEKTSVQWSVAGKNIDCSGGWWWDSNLSRKIVPMTGRRKVTRGI